MEGCDSPMNLADYLSRVQDRMVSVVEDKCLMSLELEDCFKRRNGDYMASMMLSKESGKVQVTDL